MTDEAETLVAEKTSSRTPTTLPENDPKKKARGTRLKFAGGTKEASLDGGVKLEPESAIEVLGGVSENDPATDRIVFRIYRQRWIILAIVALLNNSNTLTWISFASISNHVDVFYAMEKAANWFSLVYIICTIPVGLFAMWMGSSFGLRTAILIAAWANGMGNALRLLSSFLPAYIRFPVGIFGQAIAACAYPFIMFLPPKVAGSWFPENQRALATTIGVMANPLGVLMANLLSPQIVHKPDSVPIVNAVTAIPAILVCIAATFLVNRSEPKTPPTKSAAQMQTPFFEGVRKCFKNVQFMILLVVLGGGIGMFNCLYTVMQQLLCPMGYSNSFSGLCAALVIGGGVLGASLSGIFVDRTKWYEETIKVCMSLAVVCGILFLQLTLHPDLHVYLATSSFFFGAFGLAAYPVGLEMAAECTFPVSETTSTGLVVLSGQIQSIAYIQLMDMTARPLQAAYMHIQVCSIGNSSSGVPSTADDKTISVIAFSTVASALAIVTAALFKPVYRRLMLERGKRPEEPLSATAASKSGERESTETNEMNDMKRTAIEDTVPLKEVTA